MQRDIFAGSLGSHWYSSMRPRRFHIYYQQAMKHMLTDRHVVILQGELTIHGALRRSAALG
jgi:predicted component of type VI protein secretion system